jgi:hypothetical protein
MKRKQKQEAVMKAIVFTIQNDEVVAHAYHDTKVLPSEAKRHEVWSVADYEELLAEHEGWQVAYSSKMDFPHEYTNKADTIALARWIRA